MTAPAHIARHVPDLMTEAGVRVLQQWLSEYEHQRTLRELINEIYAAMECMRAEEGDHRGALHRQRASTIIE